MDWVTYRERYDVFVSSLGATGLLAHVGSAVLDDFPNNLPLGLKISISEDMMKFYSSMKKVDAKGKTKTKLLTASFDIDKLEPYGSSNNYKDSELFMSSLWMAMGQLGIKQGFQWDRFLKAQHLVMVFAYFDAFFSDSVMAICELGPEVLRRDKKISWRDALEQGNWDNLIQRLTEDYIFELGMKDVVMRLRCLEEEFSLKLDIPPEDLEAVRYAELVRHLVVHTGGRITPEFLRRAGSVAKGLKIGGFFTIDTEFLKRTSDSILMAGSDLFRVIATKFFKKRVKRLTRVLRRV